MDSCRLLPCCHTADRPSKAPKAKKQSAPAAARGAFLEDQEDGEDNVAALEAAAVPSKQPKARKTYRSRSDD
jgi:hypothetical protein